MLLSFQRTTRSKMRESSKYLAGQWWRKPLIPVLGRQRGRERERERQRGGGIVPFCPVGSKD
jgi:hypothetical protein